jgi:adenylate kinase family enzyme
MAVKLFILGLPGSGKSTIARYVSMRAGDRQWSTTHIGDYAILYKMFQEDAKEQFKPACHGGFDVFDLTVFDTALKTLEQQANRYFSSAKSDEIVLIEFARNDYQKAFHQFRPEFLQNAYLLFLNVDIETCKRRIRERIANPTTPDDHFVSEYIFRAYYNKDDGQDIPHILERDYGIDKQRVLAFVNNCSLKAASESIDPFIDTIIASVSTCVNTVVKPGSLVGVI